MNSGTSQTFTVDGKIYEKQVITEGGNRYGAVVDQGAVIYKSSIPIEELTAMDMKPSINVDANQLLLDSVEEEFRQHLGQQH